MRLRDNMAMTTIYTTFIERESCFVKIWVQKEKNISLFIEHSLMQMKPQFDAGAGGLAVEQLQPGLLCCAKFKDNSYYRARITNVAMRSQGMVEVLFIDYGNRDLVPLGNIRTISNFPTSVISMPEQAKDFILAKLQLSTSYPDAGFEQIANEIRYLDLEFQYVAQVGPYSLLSLSLGGQDLADSFSLRQLAQPIEITVQLMMLQNFIKAAQAAQVPRPLVVSQPAQQGIMAQRSPPMQTMPPPISPTSAGQPNFLTYKSLPLKVGSEHTVYVSYVTDGPCLFSIQLQNKEQELQELMFELNKLPLLPIEENILPGCVCLARSSEDNYICRAVITNMVEDSYKVFFVDFGNTEVRSFDNLFQIPFKYVINKVMATRFTLNGLQGQVVSLDMKVAFKTFVDNKALRMRVCAPSPKTGVSICELWSAEGVSALDFVRGASLQAYPEPVPLSRGFNQDVKVSYVFSCVKFHVQLRKKEGELTKMMQDLQTADMRLITPELLKLNAPCIALYEADGMYYRAQILAIQGNDVLVKYVDYGNEENIPVKDIRAPMMEFITNLRPQAIECCLNGYQNMENDTERDNLLEELLLEQDFSMKVADVQGTRILVDLFDAMSYNVASLLLDKMAKNRSQVSPALVQDNRIDLRKTTPTKYSPREKTDSWREKDRERPPRNTSSDWRQNKDDTPRQQHQNSFDREGNNDYRKKVHSNTFGDRNNRNSTEGESNNYQERRKPQTWTDRGETARPPRDNNWGRSENTNASRPPRSNEWGGDDDKSQSRTDSNWNEGRRQNNYGGGNRRENPRENSWGENKRENSWGDNKRENSWSDNKRESRFDNKRENSSDSPFNSNKDNTWDSNKQPEREFKKRSPRSDNTWSDQTQPRHPRRDNRSEDGSEKSFSSTGKTFKPKRDNFGGSPPKKHFDDNADYAELSEQFAVMNLLGTERKATVSWFYDPTNFFLQPVDDKAKFDAMMKDVQYAYRKRRPEKAEVGNCVIALFPEDRALYRAIITETPAAGSYKVIYADFGNSAVTNKVYKVERRFMELPAQAVQCGLANVQPAGQQWPKADAFGKYFQVDIMNCKFENAIDSKYIVDINTNGRSLKDELQAAGLVLVKNPFEHFDITYLVSQQIYCKLNAANGLGDIELEVLPGLIVSGAVYKHDVATTPDLDTLNILVGQMIVAFVDEVVGNKVFVTLYNTTGHFIPVIELQEGMFDFVNPICPALITGQYQSGYVPHATPKSVFVQLEYTAKNVELLLEQLFARYESSEHAEFEVKEIIYAVKSSDSNWYRGLVKSIEGDEVTVQFIDYGNEEVVNKSALRLLSEDFFTPHLAAEIVVQDAESFLDQEIQLKVVFDEENWVGEVVKQPQVQQPAEHAPTSAPEPVKPPEIVHVEERSLPEVIEEPQQQESLEAVETEVQVQQESQPSPIGFSVELSHSDNPGQFYLQVSSALDAIAQLQDELQSQIESLADIENVTTGILCAALYSVDETWYRAQVLDADSEITTVRFIDYGNTDVLRNNTKIKTLPAELLSLEEHAKRCSLHLSPATGEWTADACRRFEEMITVVPLTAEIVHQDEKTTFVRLYANNTCINDVFIQEGLAIEMQAPQAAFTGFVSNLNSPAEFWLQFEHACSDLEWIADQLLSADKFKLLEDQAPGTLCAAIFPDDESWYRARILSNTVAGVEVLFIDYGNSCTSTSLRELPEDLVMVPAMAHKCSLLKPQGLLEWPMKATDKFKEISAEGVTVFTVIKHSQGETNQVQLILNGDDVTEILKPELFNAKILNFTNLSDFALRKCEFEEKFNEVQSKIQDLTEKPSLEEVVVAAQYENVFYRAKINGAIVDKSVVDLLDLGIEADVTELRQLPKEIAEVQPLAMAVRMSPVVGYTFDAESDSYFKTLHEKEQLFQVELVTDNIVKLYLNGCDVREKMPATKCTPMSSVHSTPKKAPPADVGVDKHVLELMADAEGEDEEVASPILPSKTTTEFDDTDVTMKTVEITQITDVIGSEKATELEVAVEEKVLSLEEELRQAENKMADETETVTESVKFAPTEVILAEVVPTEVLSVKVEPTEVVDVVTTEVVPSEVEPTEVVSIKVERTEDPTEVAPAEPEAPVVVERKESNLNEDQHQEQEQVKPDETDENEEVLDVIDMVMSVTDQLVDKVAKQCNLLDEITSVTHGAVDKGDKALLNGKKEADHEVKNGGECPVEEVP